MLYQLGIILIIVVAAMLVAKRLKNSKDTNLIYEDEMDEDELKKIDDEINLFSNSLSSDL